MTASPQSVTWDGRDSSGRTVANGVYMFHVPTAYTQQVVKGVWIR